METKLKSHEVLSEHIKGVYSELFPDNKIPIFMTPLNKDNVDYITWNAYSSTGPYSTLTDNSCQPNELGDYQYPTPTGLVDCNNFYPNDILEMVDLNTFLYNTLSGIKNITNNDELMNYKIDETRNCEMVNKEDNTELNNKLNTVLDEYKQAKQELANEERVLKNFKNIETIIRNLNNKYNEEKHKTDNLVNIKIDSIDEEEYRYLDTQYYYYIIGVLIVVIIILHISS